MFTWLAPLFTAVFAQSSPFLQPHYLKVLDNSPFTPQHSLFLSLLLFSPSYLVFSCIPYILLDICVPFLTLPHSCPPPSTPWNAKFLESRGIFVFIFCSLTPAQEWSQAHYQFSSVVSDSVWPRGLQHARLPCPSPTLRAYSNSCPLCRWCHPTISSSTIPFFSCLQSFPASRS